MGWEAKDECIKPGYRHRLKMMGNIILIRLAKYLILINIIIYDGSHDIQERVIKEEVNTENMF